MNTIDWGKIYCYMRDPWESWGDDSNTATIENTSAPDCLVPQFECGTQTTFAGQQAFPTIYNINLGSSTGVVTLTFNAFSIPDKFQVVYDGNIVIDTGYRGSTGYQAQLDAELTSRGLPTETITSPGNGSVTFNKTTSTTTAQLRVYAPLPNTGWEATLSCPV